MKKIFTLSALICSAFLLRGQAVLNEIYPQPGNSYQEYFELYNSNNAIEYLDNYTFVAYYEEGTKAGFYVLDLPNDSVDAHSYYVGASKNPFDIQAQLGQIADFNWNAMPAGGALTKWERNGTIYNSVTVPANLNDLMVKVNGGPDGVYHVFIYKNGILVNGVVGGINTTTMPATIKAMPNLFVDMSGSSPDFTINFNTIADNLIEFIPNSLGTNNGYYRSSDGLCGDWLKSDQPGQHNPNSTNGLAANLNPANQVSIGAVISQYTTDPTKSLLIYNITAGPAAAFPVTVEVYLDLGIAGQLDINDALYDSRSIASISAGAQNIILPSWDSQVIIVLRSVNDCYNRTIAVGNFWSVLPIDLISFTGNLNKNNRVTLEWKVANNEDVNLIEIERSSDGVEFKTVGLVFGSEKRGDENYMFYETVSATDRIVYRLKMIDKQDKENYSKVIIFQSKAVTTNNIRIIGNPVADKLTLSYTAAKAEVSDIKVYDLTGRTLLNNKLNNVEGLNTVSFALDSAIKPGMYVLEVRNGTDRFISKFVKQ